MSSEHALSGSERQLVIDQRLDEIDRALLGLLPRSERLAVMASIEGRVRALGDDATVLRESAPVPVLATALRSPVGSRGRSRLALTAGVLGIVAAAGLIAFPVLLVCLSMVGDLLGETLSIGVFGLFSVLVAGGGALAVCLGVASIIRLSRRGQTATGTGWAITGLCTGALPMLLGGVATLALGATVFPSESIEVTWNAAPSSPPQNQEAAPLSDAQNSSAMLPSAPVPYVSPAPVTMPEPLPPPALPTPNVEAKPQLSTSEEAPAELED
jgi:hypothetical protein